METDKNSDENRLASPSGMNSGEPETSSKKPTGNNTSHFQDVSLNIFFEMSPDLFCVASMEGFFIHLNPAWEKTLGYSLGELMSKPFTSFIHPDDVASTMQEFNGQFIGKEVIKAVNRYRCRDGSYKWLEWRGKAHVDGKSAIAVARDITENKLIQQQLTRVMAAVESSSHAIVISDINGHHIYQNRAYLDLFGFSSADEALAYENETGCLFIKNPAQAKEVFDSIRGGNTWKGELEMVRMDGTVFYAYQIANEIRDEAGNIIGMMSIISDITDSKRAEKELRISEERYRLLAENSRDVIWTMNLDGTITYISPSIEQLRGVTVEEAMKQTVDEIHPPDSKAVSINYVIKVLADIEAGLPLENFRGELEYYRKDGSTFWAEVIVYPIVDNDGKSVKLLGVSRDISERRQAAEALKKSEENYRLLAEKIADVIWIINVTQNRITYCSPSVERLRGYTAEETMNQNPDELLTPDSVELAKQRIEMIVNDFHINKDEHKTWFNQYKQTCKEGGWKWIETAINCRLNEKGETELLGVSRDIAERKKVEIELDARNRELKEMNMEKDKFFSIIAHDLRSPFNGFLGLLQTMESDFQSMTLEQILHYVHKLALSAHNLYQLLENLLEWSRLQRGLVTAQPSLFSLRSVAKLNCEVAHETAMKKDIVIECLIPDQLLVYADKTMVDGILRNLITNAIKFSRRGGKISLDAQEINDGYVEVSVADNGIGMTGEMMGQLFKLDVITGRAGTDNEPSCGLGLILVREFVEKNNGNIRVESAEEKGSTFYFSLPAGPASEQH